MSDAGDASLSISGGPHPCCPLGLLWTASVGDTVLLCPGPSSGWTLGLGAASRARGGRPPTLRLDILSPACGVTRPQGRGHRETSAPHGGLCGGWTGSPPPRSGPLGLPDLWASEGQRKGSWSRISQLSCVHSLLMQLWGRVVPWCCPLPALCPQVALSVAALEGISSPRAPLTSAAQS